MGSCNYGSDMSAEPAEPFAVTEQHCRERVGIKWARYGGDVIPGFVADMDFDPPPAVVDALRGHLDRGDLGYGPFSGELGPVYADWQRRHHGWSPDVDKVRPFTSALHALEVALWNTSRRGDGVVVFTPIYYPFLDAIASSGRRLVDVPLDPDGFRIDARRLDAAIDETTRIVLLCNPHNPTGRIFDDGELAAVADVARRHDLVVISDEIWGDLVQPGSTFTPAAVSDDRFAGRLVTLGSASKTFNLAGLRAAVAHVDHPPLAAALDAMPSHLQGSPSTLGITGTVAAWTECDGWLDAVRVTIAARHDQLARRLAADLPGVGYQRPDATYLAWLDFSTHERAAEFGDNPARWLLDHGGVALADGRKFGSGGTGHARANVATSAEILDATINRMASALDERTRR